MGEIILPGAKIGIIGGGQLGKMLASAAQALGYQVVIWSEEEDSPACQVTAHRVIGKFTDPDKLQEFVQQVDVATVETEHIPLPTLESFSKEKPLYPTAEIVAIAQNRMKEKNWLSEKGFPVVPFKIIRSLNDLEAFIIEIKDEIVVKTITGGYDGKGQIRLRHPVSSTEELQQITEWLADGTVVIAEKWVSLQAELSVIAARNHQKEFMAFPVGENQHRNHILHQTIVPARLALQLQKKAIDLTEMLMTELDYKGLLCVEFFCDEQDRIYINELAPRPHNSGHYTIEATITSQFEQTIRAICNLPLGATTLLSPCVMTNLLGDLWKRGFKATEILQVPTTKLHLYGKADAREKRKMGHFTTLAATVDQAISDAEGIYKVIQENQKENQWSSIH